MYCYFKTSPQKKREKKLYSCTKRGKKDDYIEKNRMIDEIEFALDLVIQHFSIL